MRGGTVRAAAALLAAAGFLGVASGTARAHDFPGTVVIPPGETVGITVTGHPPCEGILSLSANEAGKVVLNPSIFVGVTGATFPVTAHPSATGSTTLTVRWIEENAAGGNPGPCDDEGEGTITVLFSEQPAPSSSANFPSSGRTGDPVDTFTGELVLDEVPDLRPGGPRDLLFQRTYASGLDRARVRGSLGPNWRHNFEWTAEVEGSLLVLTTGRGRVVLFGKQGGEWVRSTASDIPWRAVDHDGGVAVGDPSTNRIHEFDASGRLVEVRDGKGGALLLSYDGSGNLLEVRDRADASTARALLFTHASGRLLRVRERYGTVEGRAVEFAHDGAGLLVGATDALGGTTAYAYDGDHAVEGLLVSRTLPLGNTPFTQAWDGAGRVAVQTDALGDATTLSYGAGKQAGTTVVEGPDGLSGSHLHGVDGNLAEVEDETGSRTLLETDPEGRRVQVSGAAGSGEIRTWHAASGRIASLTDGEGNTTTWTWAERADPETGLPLYDLARVDFPGGTAEFHDLDASGNPVGTVDRDGGAWERTFDGEGLLLSETDPAGGTTTRTRDGFGDPVSVTDPSGNPESFVRDGRRRVVEVHRADGEVVSFAWDGLDRRVFVTDETGRTASVAYDANGNVASRTDAAGGTVSYARDAMDRIVSVADPEGNAATGTWDARGFPASRTDRTGGVTVHEVDPRGLLLSLSDPAGRTWRNAYDAEGRLVAAEDPSGAVTSVVHDAAGRVVAVTAPSGGVVTTEWDASSRVVRRFDPEGRPEEFDWTGVGRLAAVDLGWGTVTASFVRDGAGRVVSVVDPAGEAWTLGRNGSGRVVSLEDPLGNATVFGLDARGRTASTVLPGGLGSATVSRDAAGRVTGRSFSDGVALSYDYDAAGRRIAADGVVFTRDGRGLLDSCNGIGVGRDAEGRIVSFDFDGGRTVDYTLDAAGRVLSVADWAGGGATFRLDANGRPEAMERSNGVTTAWVRDADGAVVEIREGDLASIRLQRDASGRVVRASRDLPLAPSLEAGAGVLPAVGPAQRLEGVAYDALGRTLDDGVRSYEWDLASRPVRIEDASGSVAFAHDAFGLPLARDDGATGESWTWNYATANPAPAVLSRDGVPVRYFVHDPDGFLLYSIEADGTGRRWYHFDEVGSTVFLTDDDGAVTDAFAWTPWGIPAGRTGTTPTPFTWLGRLGVTEERPGLYRMRRRLYDASSRRFLTPDPAFPSPDPRELNPYAYALGDPLRFADPDGEEGELVEGTGLAATAVGTAAEAIGLSAGANGLGGSALAGGAGKVGAAATVVGALAELPKVLDRMDEAEGRYEEARRKEKERLERNLARVDDLYRRKRITHDRRYALRKQLLRNYFEVDEANFEQFRADSWRVWAVTAGNLAVNLVPGAGHVIDGETVVNGLEAVVEANQNLNDAAVGALESGASALGDLAGGASPVAR